MTSTDNQVVQKVAIISTGVARVDANIVNALCESLSYDTHFIKGTTMVVATSVLPSGFVVAVETSASSAPEDFSLQRGIEVAIAKCRAASRQRLFELEAYRLKQQQHAEGQAIAHKVLAEIRAKLSPADTPKPVLSDVLRSQIEDLGQDKQREVLESAKRVEEMLATYSDSECLGLILAVIESKRLGLNVPTQFI
ncbi:hypothetical protein AB4P93_00175 (plasmid) [Pseudomonas sp. B26140]|uniref:hypothetical protein n=1 Tax=Pseudomonas sp. B26140 TaxID=3235112 RepID=UPI00378358DF